MGAEPDQLQRFRVGNAVDEHQIGLDVAVAMVNPFASPRMIAESFRQGAVCRQEGDGSQ